MRLRFVLFVFVVLTVVPAAASAKGGVRPAFGPPAAWIRENALPAIPAGLGEAQPIVTLLSDHQIQFGKKREAFWRRAYQVVSSSGVENGSQIEWSFDPTFERLVVHYVRIHRGSATLNALRPGEVKVVQRETDLDTRIYNGTLSALLFLHDVRVGDVIDYAYTIVGSNPILRGKIVGLYHLAENTPTAFLSVRLVAEKDRSLRWKTQGMKLDPAVATDGPTTEYLWTRHDLPAVVVDDDLPSWFDPYPSVEVSEFASWNEVARWASDLFERKVQSSAELREAAARFAKNPDPASRAVAAIRFVQDEVRYLGIEIGENGHQPFPPSAVVARRFGDCKDKSLLLVTFLRALGIEAHVALVDTDLGAEVANHLPSPFAFDHAIVKFRTGDHDVFVDPTETMSRGSLADLVVPPFGRALVVSPESEDLVALPPRALETPLVEERELYTVTDYEAPVRFEVETIFREEEANDMRRYLAETPKAELARKYENYYAKIDAKISAEREPVVVDDVGANIITVREAYKIPGFWDGDHRDFAASVVEEHMTDPHITRRTMPLGIKHPKYVRQTIEVALPEKYDIADETKDITSSGFKFAYSAVNLGKRFKLRYEYRSLRDAVDASEMEAYRAKLDEAKHLTGYSITRSSTVRADDKSTYHTLAVVFLGALGLVVAGLAAAQGPAYVRRRRYLRDQRLQSGESHATAILARNEAERWQHLQRMKCPCGGTCGEAHEEMRVRYGDGFNTVLRTTCARCGREGRFYFRDV